MVKLCTYCDQAATVRCKKHRQYLCGNSRCVRFHRWDDSEECAFFAFNAGLFGFIFAAITRHHHHKTLEVSR